MDIDIWDMKETRTESRNLDEEVKLVQLVNQPTKRSFIEGFPSTIAGPLGHGRARMSAREALRFVDGGRALGQSTLPHGSRDLPLEDNLQFIGVKLEVEWAIRKGFQGGNWIVMVPRRTVAPPREGLWWCRNPHRVGRHICHYYVSESNIARSPRLCHFSLCLGTVLTPLRLEAVAVCPSNVFLLRFCTGPSAFLSE
jgi:hypothetical protein